VFRIEKKLYDELKTILKNQDQSIGDFFRISLEKQQENYDNAYNKGYEEGYKIGNSEGCSYSQEKFTLTCDICGKPMLFDIKEEPKIKQIIQDAFKNWRHTTCIEKSP